MQTASAAPCRENVRTILTAHESVAPLRSSRKIAGEIASASREHAAAPQVSSQSSRPYPASVSRRAASSAAPWAVRALRMRQRPGPGKASRPRTGTPSTRLPILRGSISIYAAGRTPSRHSGASRRRPRARRRAPRPWGEMDCFSQVRGPAKERAVCRRPRACSAHPRAWRGPADRSRSADAAAVFPVWLRHPANAARSPNPRENLPRHMLPVFPAVPFET